MRTVNIDPRVVKHLGKDLITSSDVALIELVKNSIDAKAKRVDIRLYCNNCIEDNVVDEEIYKLVPNELLSMPYLIVEDNGNGMTERELENGFLTIGTDIKSTDSNTLGEKGIGRLATQRLGKTLLLETCSIKDEHTFYVYIDWEKVIGGMREVQDSIREKTYPHTKLWIFGIDLEDYIENAMQYAQISMFNEYDNININRDLKSSLGFLISPFGDYKNGEKIKINFWFDDNLVDISFPSEMLQLSESKHYFVFDSREKSELKYGLSIQPWFIERVHRALLKADLFKRLKKPHEFYLEILEKNEKRINNVLTGTLNLEELKERLFGILNSFYENNIDEKHDSYIMTKASEILDELKKIVPIEGEIYSYKQGIAIGENIIIDSATKLNRTKGSYKLKDLKNFLDNYNGIKLYRGQYRIGSLGDKENDWIKLQQFRTKGQQWYRFDLGNTVGFVSLSDDAQDNIHEISSRLDISENSTSSAFKHLINIVFNYIFYELNRKANDIVKLILEEEGVLGENITKRIKKSNSDIKEMISRNKELQKILSDISEHIQTDAQISEEQVIFPRKSYEYITEAIESVTQKIKKDEMVQKSTALLLSEANEQLKAIEIESFNNYKLMANGLITETITHELHSVSKTGILQDAQLHFDELKKYILESNAIELYNKHLYPIKNSYGIISTKIEQIRDLYSFLETTFIRKGDSSDFIYQNIEEVVADIKNNLLSVLENEKIAIVCRLEGNLWFVPKGVMLHVLYNLINNSMYWIDVRRKRAQKDAFYSGEIQDSIFLEQLDSDEIVVYDTGTGVSKEMEDLLFEPLQSGKPSSAGRGMGLYIVRKLMQSFGGDVELLDDRNRYGNRYKFLIVRDMEDKL